MREQKYISLPYARFIPFSLPMEHKHTKNTTEKPEHSKKKQQKIIPRNQSRVSTKCAPHNDRQRSRNHREWDKRMSWKKNIYANIQRDEDKSHVLQIMHVVCRIMNENIWKCLYMLSFHSMLFDKWQQITQHKNTSSKRIVTKYTMSRNRREWEWNVDIQQKKKRTWNKLNFQRQSISCNISRHTQLLCHLVMFFFCFCCLTRSRLFRCPFQNP